VQCTGLHVLDPGRGHYVLFLGKNLPREVDPDLELRGEGEGGVACPVGFSFFLTNTAVLLDNIRPIQQY